MQQTQMLPGSGKVSLVYGFIFGGIICVIDIIYSFVLDVTNPPFLTTLSQIFFPLYTTLAEILYSLIVSIPLYILLLVCFLLAGLFAARKTKKASTGTLAGLWTGVLFVAIDLLIANILLDYAIVFPQYAQLGIPASDQASAESSMLTFAIAYSLVAGLILIGIGLGAGALGGLIGRGTTPLLIYADPDQFPQGQDPPR